MASEWSPPRRGLEERRCAGDSSGGPEKRGKELNTDFRREEGKVVCSFQNNHLAAIWRRLEEGANVEAGRRRWLWPVLECWPWGWTDSEAPKGFRPELPVGLSGYEQTERASRMTPRFFF